MKGERYFNTFRDALSFAKLLAQSGDRHNLIRRNAGYIVSYVDTRLAAQPPKKQDAVPPKLPKLDKESARLSIEELLVLADEKILGHERLTAIVENSAHLELTPEQLVKFKRALEIERKKTLPIACPACLQVPCTCFERDSFWSSTNR